jgi:aryl-alcohol dehydrogenase-like predicted oxidoreductase
MNVATYLGGTFAFPGTPFTVNRMGYGAMQLAGKGVFGPPRDRDEAIAVLREAVDSGVNHIDTSDFYGPHVTNQIIREALHPYTDDLVIVTKVGARRDENGGWLGALSRQELIDAVHDNLRNLGMDSLHIVNLRIHPHNDDASVVTEPFTVLAELQQKGLIQHLGISAIGPVQLAAARRIAPVVCVQNMYNVAHREDDAFIDSLVQQGIAYVPFFPLGGFNPLQSSALNDIASSISATPMQVALAWLLHRSPNILLIPGTSSRGHLRENLSAASLELTPEVKSKLDALAGVMEWAAPHA